jgi:hypothetical protein
MPIKKIKRLFKASSDPGAPGSRVSRKNRSPRGKDRHKTTRSGKDKISYRDIFEGEKKLALPFEKGLSSVS